MRLKIELYILSLWLLFFLLFVNKLDIPFCVKGNCHFIGVRALITRNWIPIICLSGMLWGILAFFRFRRRVVQRSRQNPWKIQSVENISFENLSFLATYIIPLLCFDLDFHLEEERNALMLVLVLVAIGITYIKANLYYTNPSLAILNFRLYRIEYGEGTCIVITRDRLKAGDEVRARHIDENIYFIKKVSNE